MSSILKRLALAVCVLPVALPVQAYGLQVRVTAYAANPHCTKRIHPYITASEHRLRPRDCYRLIALSSDLAKRYRFGDLFRLKINRKVYTVRYQDKMPGSKHGRVDFLLPSLAKCKRFGIKRATLTLIPKDG